MLELNGKNYEIKYSMQRIEMIESVTKMPTMAELQRTNGFLGLNDLKSYIGYAIKEEGSDNFLPPKQGVQIAKEYIEKKGYAEACAIVIKSLQRDCPFFFQAG